MEGDLCYRHGPIDGGKTKEMGEGQGDDMWRGKRRKKSREGEVRVSMPLECSQEGKNPSILRTDKQTPFHVLNKMQNFFYRWGKKNCGQMSSYEGIEGQES